MPKEDALKNLYLTYRKGKIEQCDWNGQQVFSCMLSAYDAPTVIFDSTGKKIANCNYAFNRVDSICREVTNCKTIYCADTNIWGEPGVDIYNLKSQK